MFIDLDLVSKPSTETWYGAKRSEGFDMGKFFF